MLPGLGFSEILLLGVIALLVVGPKDLPKMLRELGKWTRKLQGMAAEFRQGFDELARQAELDDLRKEVEDLRNSAMIPKDIESALTGTVAEVEKAAADAAAAPAAAPVAAPAPAPDNETAPAEEVAVPAPRPAERIESA